MDERARGAFLFQGTVHFRRRLEEVRRTDPPGHLRVLKVIERLLSHPEDTDGRMHGEHHGKLKKYAGRGDYRLIYIWCEECRRANRHLTAACELCGAIPDHSVVFFDIFHKSEHDKLGY